MARTDAELLAASWAEDATRRQGDGTTFLPMLEEFEHGYVVWVRQPDGARAEPGTGVRRVVDRFTGEISTWGSIPATLVADQYRRHRERYPAAVPTVDPVATIRALARPGPRLNTAVHMTLGHDHRLRIAYGAQGDQELNHHPVVRDFLDAHEIGHVSRGAPRHAEMIVVSDILHSHDALTGEPTSLDAARRLFGSVLRIDATRIRPESVGDLSRTPFTCHTCVELYVHIGLLPGSSLDRYPKTARLVYPRQRHHFPTELVPFLSEHGFFGVRTPLDRPATLEDHRLHDPAAPLPPAGLEMCRRYLQALRFGSEPGLVHRVDDFTFNPEGDPFSAGPAADFGRRLGLRTFPVGQENRMDAVLVGDEHGRVFLLDQAGEWFLGDSDDEALITLYYGREQLRIRDDGTW